MMNIINILLSPISNDKAFFIITPCLVFLAISMSYKSYRFTKIK
ncbi:hypothetical protein UT300012_32440 [Paraclostridium bifermentans]